MCMCQVSARATSLSNNESSKYNKKTSKSKELSETTAEQQVAKDLRSTRQVQDTVLTSSSEVKMIR